MFRRRSNNHVTKGFIFGQSLSGVTSPTIGDSNGNRLGFDGTNWAGVNAEAPRFYNGALLCEGEATELSGYSADIGNWSAATTATVAQNAVGLTGASNEAFTLTDNSAAAAQERSVDTTIANNSDTYFGVFRIAYNASPSVYPRIGFFCSGGTSLLQSVVVDPSDGTAVEVNSDGDYIGSVRVGNFWYVLISLSNNNSGNTTMRVFVQPAYNTDGSVTQSSAAQGSTVFASCELYKDTWSFSPVLTTGGTTKTRADDVGYTLNISNWVDDQGSMEFELTPLFNSAIASQLGIITPTASITDFIFFHTTATSIRLSDGTQSTTKGSSWTSPGDTVRVKVRWNNVSGKMNFSVDGTSATEANYDGSFTPSGAITLFKSLTLGAAMSNLKIYSEDLGEGWLSV